MKMQVSQTGSGGNGGGSGGSGSGVSPVGRSGSVGGAGAELPGGLHRIPEMELQGEDSEMGGVDPVPAQRYEGR